MVDYPLKRFPKAQLIISIGMILLIVFFMNKFSGPSSNVRRTVLDPDSFIDYSTLHLYTDPEKDTLKKSVAGFYESSLLPTGPNDAPIVELCRLELKDNGIFWRVIKKTIHLPSGDSGLYMHVVQGYLNPFAPIDSGAGQTTVYEVRILRQVILTNTDSCYGVSNLDQIWKILRGEKGLTMQGRVYVPYQGAIVDFFPKGVLKQIDNVGFSACSTPDQFSVFVNKILWSDISRINKNQLQHVDNNQLIKQYYLPLILQPNIALLLKQRQKSTASADVALTITGDGRIASVSAPRSSDPVVKDSLVARIKQWTFPVGPTDEHLNFSFTFTR